MGQKVINLKDISGNARFLWFKYFKDKIQQHFRPNSKKSTIFLHTPWYLKVYNGHSKSWQLYSNVCQASTMSGETCGIGSHITSFEIPSRVKRPELEQAWQDFCRALCLLCDLIIAAHELNMHVYIYIFIIYYLETGLYFGALECFDSKFFTNILSDLNHRTARFQSEVWAPLATFPKVISRYLI